jgi:3-oxoacyl-[acyl-carrier protein] reductase
MRLAGQVALVTGAQQGIGPGHRVALAQDGADVGINYLDDRAAADEVAAKIRGTGRRACLVPGDVSRTGGRRRHGDQVASELGAPTILVNNAGVFPRVEFLAMTESDWDHVLDVNLKGSFLCAQAAARRMVEAGRGGAIVNLASVAMRGAPLGVHYSASKAGVMGLTRAMALALAPHRIRVNAIAPGLTDTAQPRYGNTEAELVEMGRQIPLGGRMATPEEIARGGRVPRGRGLRVDHRPDHPRQRRRLHGRIGDPDAIPVA